MTRLSGRVPETGTAIQGATVAIIDTQGVEDPTQWSIVANATTDANGEWSVSGLEAAATERYHAVAQYDDGAEFVNFESLPYLSTPADVFAPETALIVGTPTPTVSVGSAIPDSVVSRWLFNEGSGTTATDSISDNDGTISGATYTTDSAEGSHALDFDGSGDVVNYGSPNDLSISAIGSAYTLFAYVKVRAIPTDENDHILEYNDTGGNDPVGLAAWGFDTPDTGLQLYHDDGSDNRLIIPETSFSLDQYYFFAGRYDGTEAEARLYDLDASLIDSVTQSVGDLAAAGANAEWKSGSGTDYDGLIDAPGIADAAVPWGDVESELI